MPRSGRPKSVRTPRLKKIVMDRIRRNPKRSVRKMASEFKVSLGSMQNLVRKDLHLSSFKRRTVHFLSDKKRGLLEARGYLLVSQLNSWIKLYFLTRIFTIEEAV